MYAQHNEPAERLLLVSELIDAKQKPKDIMKQTGVSRSEVMAAFRWTKVLRFRGYRKGAAK